MNTKTKLKIIFLSIILFGLFGLAKVSLADSPQIWYTDIIAGPTTGGENNHGCYLTITGQNFGTPVNNLPPSTTHVYINGIEVAAYKYLGQGRGRPDSWQLSVQVGSVTSGAITVTTPDGTATAPENFTVNNANMLFISPSGNDTTGDGTFANPWKTPNKALESGSFAAGTHIVVRGGTYLLTASDANLYNGRWLYMGAAGDTGKGPYGGTGPTNACTVMGYPGETVTVDWDTITDGSYYGIRAVAPANYDYWVFSGITFNLRNGHTAVMTDSDSLVSMPNPATNQTHANYSRWVNLSVTNVMSSGLCDANGGYNAFDVTWADNSKFYGLDLGNQASSGNPACASHVFYYAWGKQNSEVAYSYFHDMPYGTRGVLQVAGDGGDVYYTWNSNFKVHHNYFKNLAGDALLCNLGSYQVKIYDNIFEDCGNGIYYPQTGWTTIDFKGAKQDGTPAGDYELYNNTFYSGGRPDIGVVRLGFNSCMPNSVHAYNNIFYAKTNIQVQPGSSNVGTGVINDVKTGVSAQNGNYTVTCNSISPNTTFSVKDPNNNSIGIATLGTPFTSSQISFIPIQGAWGTGWNSSPDWAYSGNSGTSTPFAVGDTFTINVAVNGTPYFGFGVDTNLYSTMVSLLTFDYNLYYGSNVCNTGAMGPHCEYGGGGTMTSWEGPHSSITNPLFTNLSNHDLTLTSSSPAKDAGTPAPSSLFDNDYSLVSRPQGSAWDIGAYEYQFGGGTTIPAAPSGLSVY